MTPADKLIPSNWYRINGNNSTYHIFKYKSQNSNTIACYKYKYSEYIYSNGPSDNFTSKVDNFYDVDTEEVYKYFPEEKPITVLKWDNLIEDVIYVGDCFNRTYIFRQGKKPLTIKEHTNGCNLIMQGNFTTDLSGVRLATIDEIKHLNACITAGKYVEAPKESTKEITIPKYVKCINKWDNISYPTIGRIYQIINNYIDSFCLVNSVLYRDCFIPATEEEYEIQIKSDFIKEAKLRYPIGTKIRSLFDPNTVFVISSTDFIFEHGVLASIKTNGTYVYYLDKWAEIIDPKVDPCQDDETGLYYPEAKPRNILRINLPEGFILNSKPVVTSNKEFFEPIILTRSKRKTFKIII